MQLECEVCGKLISRSDHLKTYMKNVHQRATEKIHFICSRCGMASPYRSNWTAHMKNKHKLTDDDIERIKLDGIPTKKMVPKNKCTYTIFH